MNDIFVQVSSLKYYAIQMWMVNCPLNMYVTTQQ